MMRNKLPPLPSPADGYEYAPEDVAGYGAACAAMARRLTIEEAAALFDARAREHYECRQIASIIRDLAKDGA